MKKFQPTHKLFSGWCNLDQYKEISVGIGAVEAASRHLDLSPGDVICYALPKLTNGGYAGTGAGPGFVVALPLEALLAAGFTEQDILAGYNCPVGDYYDHNHGNDPVCSDCILLVETLNGYKRRRSATPGYCWSCAAAIFEGIEED